MRGHIRKRGDSYAVVIDMGRQPARRCPDCGTKKWVRDYRENHCPKCGGTLGEARLERRQRWETHRTKKAAEAAGAKYADGVARGMDPFPKNMTVGAYLTDWLERHRQRVRPLTFKRYRHFIQRWWIPELGEIGLDRLRPAEVQRTLDRMSESGLGPRTIRQARAVLSVALSEAVKGELAIRNPVQGTRCPKPRNPNLAVLKPDDVIRVLDTAKDTPWRLPILLSGMTGARRSEVLGVKWSDIDLDARRLTIQRTLQEHPDTKELEFLDNKSDRSKRTVTLTPTAVEALRAHRKEQNERRLALGVAWHNNDLVCERGDGAPLHPDAFTKATKKIMRQAGLPANARLHDLRHGVAVLLALEGTPLECVSAVLGHASPGFTLSVYGHVLDEMTEAAADAIERRLGERSFAGGLQETPSGL